MDPMRRQWNNYKSANRDSFPGTINFIKAAGIFNEKASTL